MKAYYYLNSADFPLFEPPTEAKLLGTTVAPRRSERIDAAHEASNLICYYLLAFGIAEGLDDRVMEGKVEMVLLGPAVGASDFTFTLLLS